MVIDLYDSYMTDRGFITMTKIAWQSGGWVVRSNWPYFGFRPFFLEEKCNEIRCRYRARFGHPTWRRVRSARV